MKPKYAKMLLPPKTEEDRLRLRILQLEAEVAYLKELRMFRLQDEAGNRNYSMVKNASSLNIAIEFCTISA